MLRENLEEHLLPLTDKHALLLTGAPLPKKRRKGFQLRVGFGGNHILSSQDAFRKHPSQLFLFCQFRGLVSRRKPVQKLLQIAV